MTVVAAIGEIVGPGLPMVMTLVLILVIWIGALVVFTSKNPKNQQRRRSDEAVRPLRSIHNPGAAERRRAQQPRTPEEVRYARARSAGLSVSAVTTPEDIAGRHSVRETWPLPGQLPAQRTSSGLRTEHRS